VKRLVLFTEGRGDRDSVPALVSRLLARHNAQDCLFVDPKPYNAQNLGKLLKRHPGQEATNWVRWLGAASKKPNAAAVLLVLDGDAERVNDPDYRRRFGTDRFCPYRAAAHLIAMAHQQGAALDLSVAVAFAIKEIEAWALCAIEQMAGSDLGGGVRIPAGLTPPHDPNRLRSAKQWLQRRIEYKPSQHQKALLGNLPLEIVRERSRSFRHLDHVVDQLVHACRAGTRVYCPPLP